MIDADALLPIAAALAAIARAADAARELMEAVRAFLLVVGLCAVISMGALLRIASK